MHRDHFNNDQVYKYERESKKYMKSSLTCKKCSLKGDFRETFMRCMSCEIVKPLVAFTKPQRKLGDQAKCLNCIINPSMNVNLDEDAGNEDISFGNSGPFDSSLITSHSGSHFTNAMNEGRHYQSNDGTLQYEFYPMKRQDVTSANEVLTQNIFNSKRRIGRDLSKLNITINPEDVL